jgi:hypothetical protein
MIISMFDLFLEKWLKVLQQLERDFFIRILFKVYIDFA